MAELEARGIPTVGVATTEFIEGAKAQAKSLGTDPALVFIPHPVQDRTDDESRRLADEHFDAIVKLLVKSPKRKPLSRTAGEGGIHRVSDGRVRVLRVADTLPRLAMLG